MAVRSSKLFLPPTNRRAPDAKSSYLFERKQKGRSICGSQVRIWHSQLGRIFEAGCCLASRGSLLDHNAAPTLSLILWQKRIQNIAGWTRKRSLKRFEPSTAGL